MANNNQKKKIIKSLLIICFDYYPFYGEFIIIIVIIQCPCIYEKAFHITVFNIFVYIANGVAGCVLLFVISHELICWKVKTI